jgi:AcrR family transcriptional regulator
LISPRPRVNTVIYDYSITNLTGATLAALHFRSNFGPAARARERFLTRVEIIEAAAGILERDGYDALSMRSIAEELGVKATALYRYVGNRRDLDDILFDHLMADCAPAVEGEDWRDDLRRIATAWRARLIGKRDATRIALEQGVHWPQPATAHGGIVRRAAAFGIDPSRRARGLSNLHALRAQLR